MTRVTMNLTELRRQEVLSRIGPPPAGLSLLQASSLLDLSYRQIKRLYARYRLQGPQALAHGLRGRPSNRTHDDAFKSQVLKLAQEHFGAGTQDPFGPTLAVEHLEEEFHLKLSADTYWRWLKQQGLWKRQRKRSAHRKRREPKAHFGEMLQMDGSFHAWLGADKPRFCLMHIVDDATSTCLLRLDEQETIFSAATLLKQWIMRYGVPKSLYVDLRNMYGRPPSKEDLIQQDDAPHSALSAMCQKLGIAIHFAYSPQAKGRVERYNGVHQDRLLKKMRRLEIDTLEAANHYLDVTYCDHHNTRFKRPAASEVDFHCPLPKGVCLDNVLVFEEVRSLSKDWVVRYQNRLFQLKPRSSYGPAQGKVTVVERLDRSLRFLYRGEEIEAVELQDHPTLHKIKAGLPRHYRQFLKLNPSIFAKNRRPQATTKTA